VTSWYTGRERKYCRCIIGYTLPARVWRSGNSQTMEGSTFPEPGPYWVANTYSATQDVTPVTSFIRMHNTHVEKRKYLMNADLLICWKL
jgi:hypothetical protein